MLQFMGSQSVRHNLVTDQQHLFLKIYTYINRTHIKLIHVDTKLKSLISIYPCDRNKLYTHRYFFIFKNSSILNYLGIF